MSIKRAVCMCCLISALFPLSGEEQATVLQRVYVAPMVVAFSWHENYVGTLPDTLFSLVTVHQPLVRVKRQEDAHSVIESSMTKSATGDILISIGLITEGTKIKEATLDLKPDHLDVSALEKFLAKTAADFVPFLAPVPPAVRVTSLVQNEELKAAVESIDFNDRMNKPFELSLTSYILQKMDVGQGGMTIYATPPFPLYLEFSWNFQPNNGLTASLYFETGKYRFFASPDDVETDASVLLGGIGYTFLTHGRLQAGFGVSLFFGSVFVKPPIDIDSSIGGVPGFLIPSGTTTALFYSMFHMKVILGYNFTPEFGIKIQFGAQVNLLSMILQALQLKYWDAASLGGRFEMLAVGIVWRF